jgi:hypothetical protein
MQKKLSLRDVEKIQSLHFFCNNLLFAVGIMQQVFAVIKKFGYELKIHRCC